MFAKFNLKVYYRLPMKGKFSLLPGNVDHIQQATNLFDWENASLNTDVEVLNFSNTVFNILNN